MQAYTEDFFNDLKEGAKQSAQEIVPLVLELVQPCSVVDIGCGSGEWLSVFNQHGIEDILGIDGDYVDQKSLTISPNKFVSFDLTKAFTIDRKFDLVVSLEVAEHLPAESAEIFIDSLTRLGSAILFSAAIPFQGGTQHINEQWPEYWIELFKSKNYEAIDCIRPQIWQNQNVEYWYIQNTFMFVQKDYLEQHELLKDNWEKSEKSRYSLVHPQMYLQLYEATTKNYEATIENYEATIENYEEAAKPKNMSLKKVLSALPIILKKSLTRKIKIINNQK
ncbi:MAG TPA: methyltransferase domain-containing protein [Coleofasciculaceae cyanobacterium]